MGTLFIENRSRIERYYARSALVRFGPVFIKKSTLYLNVFFSRIERNSTCGGLSPFRARDNNKDNKQIITLTTKQRQHDTVSNKHQINIIPAALKTHQHNINTY